MRKGSGRDFAALAILLDQGLFSLRNILVILLISRGYGAANAGVAVTVFTAIQLATQLIQARFGEPFFIAPTRWALSAVYGLWRPMVFSLVCALGVVSVASLLLGVGPAPSIGLGILACFMPFYEVSRSIVIRGGRASLSVGLSGVGTAVLLVLFYSDVPPERAILWFGFTLALLSTIAMSVGVRTSIPAAAEFRSWDYRAASRTGVLEIGISYFVTGGTLVILILVLGFAQVPALRVAQSCFGPIQILSAAVRNIVSIRISTGKEGRTALAGLVSATVAVGVGFAVMALPASLIEGLLQFPADQVTALFPALTVQIAILAWSAPMAAKLRANGKFGTLLRIRSAAALVTLSGFAALLTATDSLSVGVWALALGAFLSLPLWLRALR